MRPYPAALFLIAAAASAVSSAALAADAPARLVEPHDDAVTPSFLSEHSVDGFAIVEVLVTADGKPTAPHTLALTHPDLAQYANDAVMHWRYTPSTRDGTPVPARLGVPVWFRGNLNVTDDTLRPLVQAAMYINNAWAVTHGIKGARELITIQAHRQLMGVLLTRGPNNHLVANREATPKIARPAADLINKQLAQAEFPPAVLDIVTHLHGLTIVLPVLAEPAAARP